VAARGRRAAAIHLRCGRVIGIADFDDVPARLTRAPQLFYF